MTTKIKLANNVADVDLTTTAPTNGQGLIYNSTSSKWVPGAAGGGVTTYDTIDDLPLSGVDTGALALVDSTNKLYLWMDTGWYNIATINTSPSITGGNETPYTLANDGTPTVITLVASDPEGIPLTWSYEVTSGSLTNGGGTTATVSNVDNVFTVTPTTTEAYAGAFSLTFKASDGVNLGTTVASFTLAFRIPDSNYTTLLAKGVAATQNATFVDSSTNAHTITRNGDVYQGTFSPYREGGYSMYFDGDGDYLSFPNSSSFAFGTGAFTIEFWINASSTTSKFILGGRAAIETMHITTGGIDSTEGALRYVASSTITSGSTLIVDDTWHHCAIVRDESNNVTLYVDGVSRGTGTDSTNYTTTSGTWFICANDLNPTQNHLNGYIGNFRIVKGTAVYTSNFTPPTAPLEAITNTSLLINTPYIADSSSNAHAITVNGDTSTQPFSPFDYKAYDDALNGGSAYFDGAGDYLRAPDSATLDLSTGDFTIECWILFKAFINDSKVYIDSSSGSSYWQFNYKTARGLGLQASSAGGDIAAQGNTSGWVLGNWYHIALVRSGSNFAIYRNGVSIATGTYASSLGYYANRDIGGWNGNTAVTQNAFIADLRVVKGTAVYTANFTPPTAPLTAITNTSLLLNFTNAGVQDYSQVSDLKLVGNATGSNTQTKYASYSMYFDGTGDYLVGGTGTPFVFGTGDFTVECWVYVSSASGFQTFFSTRSSSNSQDNEAFYVGLYTGTLTPTIYGSAEILRSTASLTANTWSHVAAARENGTIRIFVDGAQSGSTTYTTNLTIGNATVGATAVPEHPFNGYIEDLRITKGLARYTSNFTPPTSELLG